MIRKPLLPVVLIPFSAAFPAARVYGQSWEACTPLVAKTGNQPGHEFGSLADALGDLDGDGVLDFAVGAPFAANSKGSLTVYSGASGAQLWKFFGQGFQEFLGWQGGDAGDVNGDLVPDVVVSAPSLNFALPGKVYALSGVDGSVLHTWVGENVGDKFGDDTAGVGDVNQDGFDDILVGAPLNEGNGTFAGRAYVYSGADGSELYRFSGAPMDFLGPGVAGVPDLTGDGVPEMLVAATGAGPPNAVGRVHVFSGADGSCVTTVFGDPATDGGFFGLGFLGAVGDLNGDDVEDFTVTDLLDTELGPMTGKVYAFSGADFSLLYAIAGTEAGETFGVGHGRIGDVDGDGYDDLLFAGSRNSKGGVDAGRVTVFSGLDGSALGHFTGDTPFERFGFDCAGLGDTDGDQIVEILVSAQTANQQGAAYVLSLAPRPPFNEGPTLPNSVGPGIVLDYRESTSVAQDAFTLVADGGPPGAMGLFFAGNAPLVPPYLPGTVVALPPRVTFDAQGHAERTLSFGAGSPLANALGSTWYFQLIYLDSIGPPFRRHSDNLVVEFCP